MQKWGNEKKQMCHEYATRSYFKKKGGGGGHRDGFHLLDCESEAPA